MAEKWTHDSDMIPADYLKRGNSRLHELQQRYDVLTLPVLERTLWQAHYIEAEIDLGKFRADNAYVWQHRDRNEQASYEITERYLAQIDRFGFLDRLGEDGAFGAETTTVSSGRLVSRDLLDSVTELYALDRAVNILERDSPRVLDIGAGYGRLAHRLATALPTAEVRCVDAVATSTFLCEFNLSYRGVEPRARAIPLDELPALTSEWTPDIATNMHSFSECPRVAIRWWLEKLISWGVPYLLIVPNDYSIGGRMLLSLEPDRSLRSYGLLLAEAGYVLVESWPKYADPTVQDGGVSPTQHFLFRLKPHHNRAW